VQKSNTRSWRHRGDELFLVALPLWLQHVVDHRGVVAVFGRTPSMSPIITSAAAPRFTHEVALTAFAYEIDDRSHLSRVSCSLSRTRFG